jgi:hypothetical protein
MKIKTNNMAKDTCIMCGDETPYDYETHIDLRYGYVEGAGQLCKECYENKVVGISTEEIMKQRTTLITISAEDILRTPNDQELGAKIRKLYYDNRD